MKRSGRLNGWGAAFFLLRLSITPAAFARQNQPAATPKDSQKQPHSPPEAKQHGAAAKVKLEDVGHVSTATIAQKAAHDLSQGQEVKGSNLPLAGDTVSEFRAADVAGGVTAAGPDSKSKPAKVHGKVYGMAGAAGSSTRQAGGAVGVTSKSGKTSVYVGVDRSHASSPTPQ